MRALTQHSVSTIINKFAQIAMLVVYLSYFYKISRSISRQHSHKLSIVAITMGATIGLSELIWMAVVENSQPLQKSQAQFSYSCSNV